MLVDAPSYIVHDFDHAQALRRHGGTGLGAVAKLIEARDVIRHELATADVEQRAYHFADHVAQEGAAAHGIDKFFAIVAAHQLARIDFAHRGTLFVIVLGTGGRRERSEIVRAYEARSGDAHGVFIEREGIVHDI